MVRKTRKQKGGDLIMHPNTSLITGEIEKDGETLEIKPHANLFDKNLAGVSLNRANLEKAILVQANLTDTSLEGANLKGAQLNRAILNYTHLNGADLTEASLNNAELIKTFLEEAILKNARIKNANLTGAYLINADLTGAVLRNSNLTDAKLNGADLTGADLRDTDLKGTDLRGADLSGAKLMGAELQGAKLIGAKLIGADLSGAKLIGADLTGAKLMGAVLERAELEGAILIDAYLNEANLDSANLTGADLTGAKLMGAVLERAELEGAILIDAYLNEANLDSANLTGAYLNRANLKKAVLQYANLTSADLKDAVLEGVKYNINTKWPEGFTIPETAVLVKETTITLTQNMIKSNNSNRCNNKLYEYLMSLDLQQIEDKSFKIKDQTGIDEGGITRIVHDLFLKSFINKFFSGNETKILKDNVNFAKLQQATEKLIALTEKTKRVWGHHGEKTYGSINVIQINQDLLNILLAENVQHYINQNQNKNKYHKITDPLIGTFNLLTSNDRKKYYDIIGLHNGNPENLNSLLNGSKNIQNNDIKKYMIAFLSINNFVSYGQYLTMRLWIQAHWKPYSSMFSNHLSFDFETFSERVLLKFKNNEGIFSPEVKLSEFKNSNKTAYNSYKPLPLFLDYLHHSDECRMNFNILVSGSSTYGGILRIIFEATPNDMLYHTHTCSVEINIYNNDVDNMSIEVLNNLIKGEKKDVNIQD